MPLFKKSQGLNAGNTGARTGSFTNLVNYIPSYLHTHVAEVVGNREGIQQPCKVVRYDRLAAHIADNYLFLRAVQRSH